MLPIKQLVFSIFPFLASGSYNFGQVQRTSQVERKTKCSKKPTAEEIAFFELPCLRYKACLFSF